MSRISRLWLAVLGTIAPVPAFALEDRFITIFTGIRSSFPEIMTGIMVFLTTSSLFVASTLFLIGAFYVVISRGEEATMKKGKDLMTGSLIGLLVILGSYGILRTVLFIIY
jgi:hypothetical protein